MINKVVIETDISCIPTIQGNERGGVHLPQGGCLFDIVAQGGDTYWVDDIY